MTNDKPHRMLSRINILVLGLATLLHFEAIGQTTIERTLIWDKSEKTYQSVKNGPVKTISFAGAAANPTDGYMPHYTENIRLPEYGTVMATLYNEVYEPVTSSGIKADKIDATVKVTAIPGMMRKVPYYLLRTDQKEPYDRPDRKTNQIFSENRRHPVHIRTQDEKTAELYRQLGAGSRHVVQSRRDWYRHIQAGL